MNTVTCKKNPGNTWTGCLLHRAAALLLVLALLLPSIPCAGAKESPWLTASEFTRTFLQDLKQDPSGMSFDRQVSWLRQNHYITEPEVSFLKCGYISWIVVWRCYLTAFGVITDDFLYPEIAPAANVPSTYTDARTAAILTGLGSAKMDANSWPLRTAFNTFRSNLRNGKYTPLPLSDNPFAQEILKNVSGFPRRNTLSWNSVRNGSDCLPDKYLKLFLDSGWKVNLSMAAAHGKDEETIKGLADVGTRTVHLYNSDCYGWIHEFGHFVMTETGITPVVGNLFRKEAAAARSLLGNYSQTNCEEYFAEVFTGWMMHPDTFPAQLEKVAPGTARLVRDGLLNAKGTVDMSVVMDLLLSC